VPSQEDGITVDSQSVGTVGAVEAIRQFEADHMWVAEHRDELLRQYADQWIAVEGGRVIGHDTDLDRLLDRLPDPAQTCIEFISAEPVEMVL
jgi:hypothetical protein